MEITVLPGVGAEITGVDIANPSAPEFADIQSAFHQHGLVFFRGQNLDEEQHIAFAERWGTININRFFEAHPDYPQIALVRKEADQEVNVGGGWHTDHSYDEIPALGSILVARELPPAGGDTCFTNMYKAFDTLSDGLKQTLCGLRAVHSAKHIFGTGDAVYDQLEDVSGRVGNAQAADEMSDPVHPVVIRHPLSGRSALYVNPVFTLRFEGWTAEESRPLLQYLYQHALSEEFVTDFHWQPGSVALWDNRATWHYAKNDYHGHRRYMHRITIEGQPLSAASA